MKSDVILTMNQLKNGHSEVSWRSKPNGTDQYYSNVSVIFVTVLPSQPKAKMKNEMVNFSDLTGNRSR